MANEIRRAVAIAAAAAAVILCLPLMPLFMLAGAMTPHDEDRGYFEW